MATQAHMETALAATLRISLEALLDKGMISAHVADKIIGVFDKKMRASAIQNEQSPQNAPMSEGDTETGAADAVQPSKNGGEN